jgi:hypothetical protein
LQAFDVFDNEEISSEFHAEELANGELQLTFPHAIHLHLTQLMTLFVFLLSPSSNSSDVENFFVNDVKCFDNQNFDVNEPKALQSTPGDL